jgi:hypothetical protein
VDGAAEFRDLVRSLVPGSQSLAGLAVSARQDSAHWSVMDGRSIDRIEDHIQRARQRRANMSKEQHQDA